MDRYLVISQVETMQDEIVRIHAMNEMFKLPRPEDLTDHGRARLFDFHKVLTDEVNELLLCESTHPKFDDNEHTLIGDECTDFVALADVLGDIIVYAISEAVRWGIPIDKVFHSIMDSQESKLDENGKPIYSEDGSKFIKGPNFVAPEPIIRKVLAWHLSGMDQRYGTPANETRTDSKDD